MFILSWTKRCCVWKLCDHNSTQTTLIWKFKSKQTNNNKIKTKWILVFVRIQFIRYGMYTIWAWTASFYRLHDLRKLKCTIRIFILQADIRCVSVNLHDNGLIKHTIKSRPNYIVHLLSALAWRVRFMCVKGSNIRVTFFG